MPLSQIYSASIQDGSVDSVDLTSNAQYYGFKNRIINGAMVIDQRNAGASAGVTGGTYFVDRWQGYASQAGKATIQQNAGSVTPPTGFTKYLGWVVGASANVTVGSSDYFFIDQPIEGFNVADLAWGTASAATITVSFQVRSSLTGTFSGSVVNASANRSYPFSYTINSANTWETKSVTITGDTTGTWATDNTVGLYLRFCLGSGSTRLGTANTWAAANYDGVTGTTNLISTNSATFYITGVQLEKGSTATSFDYRPYSTELALCQRYYVQFSYVSGSNIIPSACFNNATTNGLATIMLPVTMRTAPTGVVISSASHFTYSTGSSNLTPSAVTFTAAGPSNVSVNCTVTGATIGNGGLLYFTSTSGAYIGVSGTEL